MAQYFAVYDEFYFLLFETNSPYFKGALEIRVEDLENEDLSEKLGEGLITSLVNGNNFENFCRQYPVSSPKFIERILNSLTQTNIFPINENVKDYTLKMWKEFLYRRLK